MKLAELCAYLDEVLATKEFSDVSYNGVQVSTEEGMGAEVKKIATACTASLEAIDAAVEAGADTLIVHHGLFWRGADPRLTGNIYQRVKTLMANGQYAEAEVSSVEPVRGITVIKGTCALPNGDSIEIESRLVGETAAKELKAYLAEQKQNKLPALVVGVDGPRPRGMFTVKCLHGHLIEASAHLKSAPPKDSAADDEATAHAKAATRVAEEQKQLEAEQAQAEQAQAEQAAPEQAETNEVQPEVAPRDDKRDAAIMDALAQAEQKK